MKIFEEKNTYNEFNKLIIVAESKEDQDQLEKIKEENS